MGSTPTRADYDQLMIPCYNPSNPIFVRGLGSRLWDQKGDEYIDLFSGIAVTALGHCHPKLVAALNNQASKLWLVSNYFANEPALVLARYLTEHTFAERAFFCNSGAEANEAALKIARKFASDHFGSEKNEILSCHHSFHGRTLFTVNVGGQPKYTQGFGPAPSGIHHFEFNQIEALEALISDKTCAVMIEPIQGEGGVIPADPTFLIAARQLCDKHHALLIFDEVQTGVGRTGSLYAYQQYGVTPDILSSAKGLGGGFPIGAILTTSKIAASFSTGSHGTTYGGNPLACHVAKTVLEIVNTPEVLNGVQQRHRFLVEKIEQLNTRYPIFESVRGKGLLLGCVMLPQYADRAGELLKAMEQQKLLALIAGPNVLRFAPSLIIDQSDLDEAMVRLENAMAAWLNSL